MKRSDVFPSNWLAKEDIETPTVATIKAIDSVMMKENGKDKKKGFAEFDGDLKNMILNVTNWTTLEMLYGGESDDWVGKKIEIYVDPSVRDQFGKVVGGLRLRAPSANGKPANYLETPLAAVWTWEHAVAEVAKLGISKEALVDALKKEGSTKWKADRDTPLVQRLIETIQADEIPFG